jgi:hypothetical protein
MFSNRFSRSMFAVGAAACALSGAVHAQGLPVTLWTQNGPSAPFQYFGEAVAGIGDHDGDGKSDWIVGAPGTTVGGLNQAGRATVYFSSGAAPVVINGSFAFERFGASLSSAGDQTGDGIPEILVAGPNNAGSGTFRGRIQLINGATYATITTFFGLADNYQWGATMCVLGDLNGDGKSEYAFNGNVFNLSFQPIPAVYVMDGSNNQIYCAQLQFGTGTGQGPADLANAGDVNGDGVNDLIVGRGVDTQVYSLPATAGGATSLLFSIAMRGEVVAGPGDVDGDGVRDIAISNRNSGPLGGLQGFVGVYSGAAPHAQLWSLLGTGGQDEFGASMDALGDVSGDGVGDIVVGAPQRTPSFLGAGYVKLLSGANGALFALWTGTGGPSNPTEFGAAVANAGDVDADGNNDFLIGDRGRDIGGQTDAGFAMIAKGALAGNAVGVLFCHCPPSSPAMCGNTHNGLGGCLNTLGQPGLLQGFGSTSVTADDLFLVASGLPATSSTFFYSGTSSAAPGSPLYSGLMCVGGTLTRLPLVTASGGVAVKGPYEVVLQGGYLAGQTAYFQAQYRNINGPCGANANETNALALTFVP